MTRFLPLFLFLISCSDTTKDDASNTDDPTDGNPDVDNDSDGFTADVDCDDNNPGIFPGSVLEATNNECMKDADGDGFGSAKSKAGLSRLLG